MKPKELNTRRLILRRTREGDAKSLFYYTSDPESSRFLSRTPHTHIDQTKKFLDKWCERAWEEESDNISWVISLASSNEAIGVFIATIEGHKAQIHFGIRPEFRQQGYACESIKVGTDWLLSNETLQRVWTVCDLENVGSIKALEKSGFKREGVLEKWLVLPTFGKSARDCCVYSYVKGNT